ncbi:MAG TPA: aminotransferase [Acidimicrobiaceae bacterium]|nr:aminotransferase [Acidimicrobiaceae bacterium]
MRNGWFSFRWSQIIEAGRLATSTTVLVARQLEDTSDAPFAPVPLDEIIAAIRSEKPDVVCCPHVETSAGLMVPDGFISAVADAVHEHGGLFVLDCVASGTVFVNLEETGVDVLLTAPQKGWSASPCAALVMMSPHASARLDETTSSSFANDLKKWTQIMETYEGGAHAYHATMPTDALRTFRDVMLETEAYGFDKVMAEQQELGTKVRAALESRGVVSVAAAGFQAPGVVVSYTSDPEVKSGAKFAAAGMQIAGGVPLQVDEGDDFSTFRLGLFGLDKLHNVDRSVASLEAVFDRVL